MFRTMLVYATLADQKLQCVCMWEDGFQAQKTKNSDNVSLLTYSSYYFDP